MKIVRLELQENTNWFGILLNKKQFRENNQKDWYTNCMDSLCLVVKFNQRMGG